MNELRAWIVYRINWLRARAKKTRWAEEAALIRKEMGWTVNFFKNKVRQWEELQTSSPTNGQQAYASKQCAMWRQLGESATALFNECRTQYTISSA
jgi:hypothetical protein